MKSSKLTLLSMLFVAAPFVGHATETAGQQAEQVAQERVEEMKAEADSAEAEAKILIEEAQKDVDAMAEDAKKDASEAVSE
ncbi:hypothetical protein [Grimontia marina]|uniref:Uncharacterized protein n=1 Tax=Grimontia marina TaxID=646534 RepID=A0A128F6Z9_9GAMM|nr:hypothetical protein [Grimontia marina]CZF82528.1 hypothetical protein GMA8713_02259 [Grimontia marina]